MNKKNRLKDRLKNIDVFAWVMFIILALYMVSLMIPFVWGLMTSFKDGFEFLSNVFGLPKEWLFSNYAEAFSSLSVQVKTFSGTKYVSLIGTFGNSLLVAVGGSLVSVFVTCTTAYLVAKYNYKFSRFIHTIVIIVMVVPVVGTLVSTVNLMRTLNLYDKYIGFLLLQAEFTGLHFLVLYGVFKSLSWDYAEAAIIDGASDTKIMFAVMIPLIYPTLFAIVMLKFIGFWNSYQLNVLYLPSMPTAAYSIFTNSFGSQSVPIKIAGNMVFILPIMTLFLLFNKKMMGNLTMGGLKG